QGARGAPGRYLFGSGGAAVVEEGPAGVWRVPEWMDDVDDVEVRCDGGGPTGVLGRRVPHGDAPGAGRRPARQGATAQADRQARDEPGCEAHYEAHYEGRRA